MDTEGYVVASKPDNSLYGDGVEGEGRRLTSGQLKESNEKMIAEVILSLGVEQHVTVPSEVLPGYNLIYLSPANVETDFGYGTSIGSADDSPLVVAAYRQKGSQQYYDYTLTIIALCKTSRLALPDSEEYRVRAQEIFDDSVGQFECYEPQECSYDTRAATTLQENTQYSKFSM